MCLCATIISESVISDDLSKKTESFYANTFAHVFGVLMTFDLNTLCSSTDDFSTERTCFPGYANARKSVWTSCKSFYTIYGVFLNKFIRF